MTSKATTLELAVLGLLHESPLHGYELRKRLNLLLGRTRLLSYGSLYPALKRLLREDLVSEVTSADPAVSRRQRIVYRILPAGQEWFAGSLRDVGPSAWEDEDFTMRFAFFSRTDAEVRLRVLEGRRSRLQERLDRTRGNRTPSGPVDRYVQELQRHSVESVERELKWLTDLIDAERAARSAQQSPHQPQAPPGHQSRPDPQPEEHTSGPPVAPPDPSVPTPDTTSTRSSHG